MIASMDEVNNEIIGILRERNIDGKLIESRQLDREKARGELFQQLIIQTKDDEEKGKRLAERRSNLEGKLQAAIAAANAARIGLNEINSDMSMVGFRAERLRGKLRSLADPRIEQALCTLRGLADRARARYKGHTQTMRTTLMGDKTNVNISNSMDVADAFALIKTSMQRLEALQEQPRPADLAAVIEKNVAPCLSAVRAIAGL